MKDDLLWTRRDLLHASKVYDRMRGIDIPHRKRVVLPEVQKELWKACR